MIRINLLGIPKTKKMKGRRSRSAAPRTWASSRCRGRNRNWRKLLLLLVAEQQGSCAATRPRAANAENKKLAAVKARYLERQKQFDAYDHRVKVIHQLQAGQQGPLTLLDTISSTVNSTDAVWLTSMTEDANNINLEGTALSANSVANLITALKKSNYFKSVEMKESIQDDRTQDMQAFQFTLICEKPKS